MLTIYRASAGAGKTHKLTGEYLKLLFSAPGAYKRILAVTFTNKATEEMKSRILSELYHLASDAPSDYLAALTETYSLSDQQVRQKAKQILIALLHDYSAFNISTIDRFFQQITRAFTREIGLQGGYGIEMDEDLVLKEAIDGLLNDLAKPEQKALLGWLVRFAETRIEEGKGWNFREDLVKLAQELFKESYRAYHSQTDTPPTDKQEFEAYRQLLFSIINQTESEAKKLGEQALRIMGEHGLQPTDFSGASRSSLLLFNVWAQGILKAPSSTFRKLTEQPENYSTKKTKAELKERIAQTVADGLGDCVQQLIDQYDDHATNYFTAKELTRYYFTLGILTDISRQISSYRAKNNIMLIADTNELLNRVIQDSDASFIYEKIGTQIDHYMIDEFQDTSQMQWKNFRPLVEESLAQGQENLIVGDVKQSIYRFRNSDWTLLDQQVHRDFPPALVRKETLQANWRSCHHIVAFNNALFTVAPALLQQIYNETLQASSLSQKEQAAYSQLLVKAYDQCVQQIPPRFQQRAGHVCVDFLTGNKEEPWETEALNRLPETVRRLQQNGYALKEIAILVRTKAHGKLVANALLQYKATHPDDPYRYDIISDEALSLDSSPTVRFFIAALRFLRAPRDNSLQKRMQYAYRLLNGSLREAAVADEHWVNQLRSYARYALYELAEALFRLVSDEISDSEFVFAQAFLDKVAEFAQKEHADLNDFLDWWDKNGFKQTIATPDGQNAIRILTIHKSKGLGFKAVILPLCFWPLDHKPNQEILWCHLPDPPFNRLNLLPMCYGERLGMTHTAAAYFEERLNAYMDNLNNLYVALTRAKEELIICAPRPKMQPKSHEPEKTTSISDLLWKALQTEQTAIGPGEPLESLPAHFDAEKGHFEWGDWWHPETHETENRSEELLMKRLVSVSPDERLHLRLHGKHFCFDDTQRKHGTVMHEILSRIRTIHDIPNAVESYQMEGVITEAEATEVAQKLTELLQLPQVKDWYNDQYRILNEVEILSKEGLTKRPDRVMLRGDEVVVVDYKFGQRLLKSHQAQVRNYLRLIREMGYTQVSGFLWYVELGKIEAVKPQDSF